MLKQMFLYVTYDMAKKEHKQLEVRQAEIQTMKDKLAELGLSTEHEGVAEFFKFLDDFEKGFGGSGSIKLTGLKRRIEFILSMKPHIQSSLALRYDPNV
jgi:hypothetical protein